MIARADKSRGVGHQAVGQGVSELWAGFALALEMVVRLEMLRRRFTRIPRLANAQGSRFGRVGAWAACLIAGPFKSASAFSADNA